MSLLDTINGDAQAVVAEVEKVVDEVKAEFSGVAADVQADTAKVEEVVTKVEADFKAIVVEAVPFLEGIVKRFEGDAVYNEAQALLAKIKAAL